MRIPGRERCSVRHPRALGNSTPRPHLCRLAGPELRLATTTARLEAVVRQPGRQYRGDRGPARTVATRGRGEVVAGEDHRRPALGTPVPSTIPGVLATPAARHAHVVDLVDGLGVPAHARYATRPASAASQPFSGPRHTARDEDHLPAHDDSPSPATTVRTGLAGNRVALHSHAANASARRTGRIHFHPFGPACKSSKCSSGPLPEEMGVINRTRSVNTVRRPADNRPDAGSAAPPLPGSW